MEDHEIIFASNVNPDGVALELHLLPEIGEGNPVLLAFKSDFDGKITFSAFKQGLPFDLVENFVKRVREELIDLTVNE